MRRVFISFRMEDINLVKGLRLLAKNPNYELDFYDESVRVPINSVNAVYIRQRISEKISRSGVVLCIVNRSTYLSEWVEWELETAIAKGKPIVAMAAKDLPSPVGLTLPKPIRSKGVNVYPWNPSSINSYLLNARLVSRY